MGLIKSSHVPTTASAFSMRDIESQARGILLRAQEQADALLGEAQREAEELKARAHVQGLAQGRKDGREQGELEGTQAGAQQALAEHNDQLTTLTNALSAAVSELDASRR